MGASSVQWLSVMSACTWGNSADASPTWLTERVGFEQSQLLSGPSFSQVKSSPLKWEETTGSDFRRLNCALPGSQWLLQAVTKKCWARRAATAIRIKPSATRPRVNIGHRNSRWGRVPVLVLSGLMLAEQRFHTGIVDLNYGEGEASGPPLVLLHGGSLRWQSFLPLIPDLSQHWHVYAPDLRGHGLSGRVAGSYRLRD